MKKLFAGAMVVTFLLVLGMTAYAADIWPIKIERAGVLPKGSLELDAGLALESGREVAGLEYDNVRLAPFGVRCGLGESAEVGGFLAFSDNSAEDDGAPDESGLEGLTLFGKLALNENVSLQAGFTFGGEDDVFPYPNDGLDVFVNVPMQRKLGKGVLYGQFGYRAQGGDLDDSSYFNYGIGYGLPVANLVNLNIELVGEQAHFAGDDADEVLLTSNTLDLVFGGSIVASKNLRVAPYISVGIYDDSPDVAGGCYLNVMF
jgi:hypothetical protein